MAGHQAFDKASELLCARVPIAQNRAGKLENQMQGSNISMFCYFMSDDKKLKIGCFGG